MPDRQIPDDAKALPVSLLSFLQDQLIQCEISYHPLEQPVLLLQVFQPTRLVNPQATIFFAPSIIRDLLDTKPAHNIIHTCALSQRNIGLAQLRYNLFRGISFSCYLNLLKLAKSFSQNGCNSKGKVSAR
jgi:hypothetical protein